MKSDRPTLGVGTTVAPTTRNVGWIDAVREKMAAVGLLVALFILLPASVRAGEEIAIPGVRLTTEASAVQSCTFVGTVVDDSVNDLRKKIIRAGGNSGLLSFGDNMLVARVFRCPGPEPGTSSSAAPPPDQQSGVSPPSAPPEAGTITFGGLFGRRVFVNPARSQAEAQRDLATCERDALLVPYQRGEEAQRAADQRVYVVKCLQAQGYIRGQ